MPEATLSYGALSDLVGVVFEETRAVLPAPQDRALAAALLLADLEEPADPRTTATALVGVLTALAAEQPVLVAVHDVQWLDPASERALEFAARRLPSRLGLLLTLRVEAGGAVPFELDRALAEDRLERVAPGPLSLAALHHLLRGRLGNVVFGSVPTYIKALTLKQRVNQRHRISPDSGPCALLDVRGAPIPKGVAYLEAVVHRYEAAIASACKAVASCRYDGGAFGRVADRPEYISWDLIHLSARGQAKAAAVAWAALKRVGIIPSGG